MAEHASDEPEEQVDFDGDNDMEKLTDDDSEEPAEDDGMEEAEHEAGDKQVEQQSSDGDGRGKIGLPDESDNAKTSVKGEEEQTASMDENDSEMHAEMLALPPHGSEIFIGGVPRDATEEDLRGLCESFGDIAEIKLVKDKETGDNKGYAFISFKTKEVAQQAIEDLHNKVFKGKTLRCSLAQVKYRLFIGKIPKSLTEEDLRKAIETNGPGVENIELLKDPQNPSRNRGFAFVEYYNHACAEYARKNMSSTKFKLDGSTPTISWADPKSAPDSSAAAQVKAVYVKNLPDNTTPEQLKELFERHGEVTKVVMPPAKPGQKRDFGFIHFAERSSALKAVKETEKYEIDGHAVEACLAKPQNDKKFDAASNPYKGGILPSYLPPGYGFPGSPYGTVGAGYGTPGFGQQPVIYGRGPMPAGMQMVPMVLPDGRLGYVLQQPGSQAPPSSARERSGGPSRWQWRRGEGDSDSNRGREGDSDGNRGRRYRPY
ncbi:heterogeneous nuclear ribonucleoprotein Q-like isoform X2 [Magnolia sinica]|uniref:heterogeneous nuclear ribonucleoprotein Q-like isoform X2 n=1 Tax=Magnolia sinica TaxID=86752 RepID=UPI00265B4AD4|nr:heterogeneous nuclear ribonucleoprotein Q-like isoform X2 [Magnolia sinica]